MVTQPDTSYSPPLELRVKVTAVLAGGPATRDRMQPIGYSTIEITDVNGAIVLIATVPKLDVAHTIAEHVNWRLGLDAECALVGRK